MRVGGVDYGVGGVRRWGRMTGWGERAGRINVKSANCSQESRRTSNTLLLGCLQASFRSSARGEAGGTARFMNMQMEITSRARLPARSLDHVAAGQRSGGAERQERVGVCWTYALRNGSMSAPSASFFFVFQDFF